MEDVVFLVQLDLDVQVGRGIQHSLVGQGEKADLVKGVGGIGDELLCSCRAS